MFIGNFCHIFGCTISPYLKIPQRLGTKELLVNRLYISFIDIIAGTNQTTFLRLKPQYLRHCQIR